MANAYAPDSVYTIPGPAVTCYLCHVTFWMTETHQSTRVNDHRSFWCPNGHEQHYTGQTEAQRYKSLYQQAKDQAASARAAADQAEASRRAWKGQATKLRKRVSDGECPFCGQSLRDLARHISRKHPDMPLHDEP